MEEIRIVEYEAKYAKSIAEMWNKSGEGWMGRNFNSSEAKVLEQEGMGTHINLYLAVCDTEVWGYAKLAMYMEEKNVAYIEMLSVLPEKHGKGLGRRLVKQCVLRSTELGFQRIDLFTWAGNTKAVPLYKKCGFFWEKMENQATHLMNFIPGILNCELLKPYFEYFDWYSDLKRELKVEPDGRKEDGFDLYDYLWEKDGKQLKVSFERRGRGIVAVCSPDYVIKTIIDEARPVFGESYLIRYSFENRYAKPMEINLKGEADQVIKYHAQQSLRVVESSTCENVFSIEPLSKELNEWETSPCVKTVLSLDGKTIELRTGLGIRYPLSINLRTQNSIIIPGRPDTFFANVQNHYPFACKYVIEIPDDDKLQILNPRHELSLQSGERAYLKVSFLARGAVAYNPLIKVTAVKETGPNMDFSVDCFTHVNSYSSRDAKNMQDRILMSNGLMGASYTKTQNKNYFSFFSVYGAYSYFCPPLIGLPFSEEFETESPETIELSEIDAMQRLCLDYRSKAHEGVRFALIYQLYPSGVVESFLKVLSLPANCDNKLLQLRINIETKGLSFEHNGQLISLEEEFPEAGYSEFAQDSNTGNWFFSKNDDACSAVIWNPEFKVKMGFYFAYWDIDLTDPQLQNQSELHFASVYLDVFRNCYQVRNAALGFRKPVEAVHPTLELVLNDGNPIVKDTCSVKLLERMDIPLTGNFELKDAQGMQLAVPLVCSAEENKRELHWNLRVREPLQTIALHTELQQAKIIRAQTCFRGGGELQKSISDGFVSYDNGLIKISCPLSLKLPGLTSLQVKGLEYLDSGYPCYEPKSWLNPYQGGLYIGTMQIRSSQLILESHSVAEITLADQFGNQWSGIAIQTEIKEYEPLKGLIYRQCYVLHPGVPVLALLLEIVQSCGWAQYIAFSYSSCLKRENDGLPSEFIYPGKDGKQLVFSSGKEQVGLDDYFTSVAVKLSGAENYLQYCHLNEHRHNLMMDNLIAKDSFIVHSDIQETGRNWLQPQFMLFSPELIPSDNLKALTSLKFFQQDL